MYDYRDFVLIRDLMLVLMFGLWVLCAMLAGRWDNRKSRPTTNMPVANPAGAPQ